MNYGCHGGHCCCLSSFCGSSERRCTSRTVQLPCRPSHRRSSFVLPCAFQMYVGQGKETNVNNAKGSAESADAFRWKYGNAVVCGLSHDHMGLKTTTAVCPSSQTCTVHTNHYCYRRQRFPKVCPRLFSFVEIQSQSVHERGENLWPIRLPRLFLPRHPHNAYRKAK